MDSGHHNVQHDLLNGSAELHRKKVMDNQKKDTNPKDALAIRKVPIHCVSAAVLMEIGLGMMEGGRKYGTFNYRAMGVKASVYYDAACRHLFDWWEGTDIDPDSGLHHLSKLLSDMCVLRDGMLMENWIDDRPIQLPNRLNIAALNQKASDIIDAKPESVAPFTEERKQDEEFDRGFRTVSICDATDHDIRLCECNNCKVRRIIHEV